LAYPAYTTPNRQGKVLININPRRLKIDFEASKGDYRSKLLQVLLHEYSHPIQEFWINNADADTQAAVFAQFRKERSGTAAQRAGLLKYILDQKNPNVDVSTLRPRLLKAFGLTEQEFAKLLRARGDLSASKQPDIYREDLSSRYFRMYDEWVAEKGAQWLSKELQGRLPQSVFEKFQKEILVKLRSIYETVAKLLGVPTIQSI
jgi:hypothetical protein